MNRSLNKNLTISPISQAKQNYPKQMFDFQNLFKLDIEKANKNLNSSLSPKHEKLYYQQPSSSSSKTERYQYNTSKNKFQNPSNTNKFFRSNANQPLQSPKNELNKSNCQLDKSQLQYQQQQQQQQQQQYFNFQKQGEQLMQVTPFEKQPQNENSKKLYEENKKSEENNNLDQSTSEDDAGSEEVSIWQENELKTSGVDTNQFMDSRGEFLNFYQIYRLRSALYQSTYVSRSDTIQEVQVLSSHFNKEIPIKQLEQQQIYLDKFINIQRKSQIEKKLKQQQQQLLWPQNNVKNYNKKCHTERANRPTTSYQQNSNYSNKLKQETNEKREHNQVNQHKLDNKKESTQMNNQEQQKKLLQNKQSKQPNKISNFKETNEQGDSYQQLSYKYKSQRRNKISLDKEQAYKLVQNKTVPIKEITLQDDDSLIINQSVSPTSAKSNNKLNLTQEWNDPSPQYQNGDSKKKAQEIGNQIKKQNMADTTQSVLSYLKKIVSSSQQFGQQYFQSKQIPNQQLSNNLINQKGYDIKQKS